MPNSLPNAELANMPGLRSAMFDVMAASLRSKVATVEACVGKIGQAIICQDVGNSWRASVPKTKIPGSDEDSSIGYKAHRRTDDPEELAAIAKLNDAYKAVVNDICQLASIEQLGSQGIEADDFMIQYARQRAAGGDTVCILSKDFDILQAVQAKPSRIVIMQPMQSGQMRGFVHCDDKSNADSIFALSRLNVTLERFVGTAGKIDPVQVIVDKVFNGDASDDISPIMCRIKNGRRYKLTAKNLNAIRQLCKSEASFYDKETVLAMLSYAHEAVHKQPFESLPLEWQQFYVDKFKENRKLVICNPTELGEHVAAIEQAANEQLVGMQPCFDIPDSRVLSNIQITN